jgi:hypothetical protein
MLLFGFFFLRNQPKTTNNNNHHEKQPHRSLYRNMTRSLLLSVTGMLLLLLLLCTVVPIRSVSAQNRDGNIEGIRLECPGVTAIPSSGGTWSAIENAVSTWFDSYYSTLQMSSVTTITSEAINSAGNYRVTYSQKFTFVGTSVSIPKLALDPYKDSTSNALLVTDLSSISGLASIQGPIPVPPFDTGTSSAPAPSSSGGGGGVTSAPTAATPGAVTGAPVVAPVSSPTDAPATDAPAQMPTSAGATSAPSPAAATTAPPTDAPTFPVAAPVGTPPPAATPQAAPAAAPAAAPVAAPATAPVAAPAGNVPTSRTNAPGGRTTSSPSGRGDGVTSKSSLSSGVLIGIGAGVAVLLIACGVGLGCWCHRRGSSKQNHNISSVQHGKTNTNTSAAISNQQQNHDMMLGNDYYGRPGFEINIPNGGEDVSTIGDPTLFTAHHPSSSYDDATKAPLQHSKSQIKNANPALAHFVADPGEQVLLIDAPPGKLGLLIDNRDADGMPFIIKVKEESVLVDQVRYGDRLIGLDDIDLRSVSATDVSELINRKRNNTVRQLMIVRDL